MLPSLVFCVQQDCAGVIQRNLARVNESLDQAKLSLTRLRRES